MGSNSAGNSEIAGSLVDRITKTSTYGKQRKSETDLKIEKIRKALSDFAKQVKSRNDGEEKLYKEIGGRIQEKSTKLKIRENNSNLHCGQ